MEQRTLPINRRSGKYEGKGALPFSNKATVADREISEILERHPDHPHGAQFRRFTVRFVSKHRYIVDLSRGFFQHHETAIDDAAAVKKLLDSRFNDAEVFRRCIRDFSKQIPLVYELWHVNDQGQLSIAGHVAAARTEMAPDSRVLPVELLDAE